MLLMPEVMMLTMPAMNLSWICLCLMNIGTRISAQQLIYIITVVSQRFSEERELLRLKFRMFVRLGWCK